ncbi:MAG: NAD-dependent epimerase/dehydratase family protein [Gammaproteobacteria bacterium]
MKTDVTEKDIELIYKSINFDFRKLENKSILITGASGHLGTYFVSLMLYIKSTHKLNIAVTCTSSGQLSGILRRKLNEFQFIQGDLTDPVFVSNLQRQDAIIHLAGHAQPKIFLQDPEKTIKINTQATFQLLDRLTPGGNLLFMSSSEIYTGSEKVNPNEGDCGFINSDHPRAPYVDSKKLGEVICINSKRYSDSKIVIARLGMTFGPQIKGNDTRAVSEFFRQGVQEKIITLLDKGLAKRRYLYVADAVKGLFNIAFLGENGIYNVGATEKNELSIYEIAKMIAIETGSQLFLPSGNENVLNARDSATIDVSKYENQFGKPDSIDVHAGIIRTLEWIKDENIYLAT